MPRGSIQVLLLGKEQLSLQELICNSIAKSNPDLHKAFYENIVLSGGSTAFKGITDRLTKEVIKKAPNTMKIKVSAPSEKERIYSAWIGGNVLASLSTF